MRKTIMTVDDSTSVRQMVKFTLSMKDYEVIEAEDGKDALTKLNEKQVDMFLVDIHMPNMGGIELIKVLRSNLIYKFTPIVILTTESEQEKKKQGREAGASGWIQKPFSPDQLLLVVKKLLG